VKISYQNKRAEKLITNPKYAIKELGKDIATKVNLRIDQIKAADSLEVLIVGRIGRCHPLHYDFEGMFGLDLNNQVRLIIKPDVEQDCKDYEEIIKCRSIIIIGVVNYHGQKNEWIFR
jgi:proteic killer suppression protein